MRLLLGWILIRTKVVMVAIFAFVNGEARGVMVVFGDFGGEFGFFASVIDDFMTIAHPATLWFVDLVRV